MDQFLPAIPLKDARVVVLGAGEPALNKLRQPTADGKRSEYADWAATTLRRLRHVQFVEELAAASVPEPPRPAARSRATGRGVSVRR